MSPDAQRPVILSEGAGIALGSVLSRLTAPPKTSGKRPRNTPDTPNSAPVVLTENQEVRDALAAESAERRRVKEARRVKEGFETNGLVVPDAATGAALERQLLETATRGAVALFNAVRNAQKGGEGGKSRRGGGDAMGGEKGKAVSKESFMSMMRAGVAGRSVVERSDEKGEESSEEEEGMDGGEGTGGGKGGAKWLRDGYLTKASSKLKDWDKGADSEESSEDSEDGESEDEPEDE